MPATSTSSLPTTTTTTNPPVTEPSDGSCPADGTGTEATVVGVVEYVRIRSEPTTASAEIGQLELGTTVTAYTDELTYDGSDFWWVPVQVPGSATCGRVAAEFLADQSGPLDQQIAGVSFRPPSTGTWVYRDRTSLLDPVEALLDGALFTAFSLTREEGALIDDLLAAQLAEFEEFEYEYPEDWFQDVEIPGADRAVRLVTIASPSGDLAINRLLIEVGGSTLEASTSVYIEDLDLAPLDELDRFLESVSIDRARFTGQ